MADKTIIELGPNECRFPIGEILKWRHVFCAAECTPGNPYCDKHMKIAYNPPRPRTKF